MTLLYTMTEPPRHRRQATSGTEVFAGPAVSIGRSERIEIERLQRPGPKELLRQN